MASNAKGLFFLLLALFFTLQNSQASRDSKFFSKVSKNTKQQHHAPISMSPTQSPSPSPSPEPEVVEHGYGLYGQDLYQNHEYDTKETNPTKVGEKKPVSGEEMSKNNNFNEFGNNEKEGMSDKRYLENGKYYYDDPNHGHESSNFHESGNGNGMERQGMSDTRFLENGKYFYDPNQDVGHQSSYFPKRGYGNGNGMERQGMSDTRFLENGKYFHDINEEGKNNGHFNYDDFENFAEDDEEEKNSHFNTNNYENEEDDGEDFDEDENFVDEKDHGNGRKYDYYGHNNGRMATREGKNAGFEMPNNNNKNEKHGMSDTRFLENGKYFYDLENEKYNNNYNHYNMYNNHNFNNNNKFGVEDVGFHSNNNVEYAKSNYHENNEYERQGRRGYNNYDHSNEYGYNGVTPKKFPNEYDTMEEYDREQGYFDGQDNYVP